MGIIKLFNSKKNKAFVFCIGMNKTGTTSLGTFLENEGFRVLKQNKGELLLSDYINNDFDKIIKLCRKSDADVFQDVPFSLPKTYKYLSKAFPESKFILTIRNSPQEWYNSILKFHSEFFNKGEKPTEESLKNSDYVYKGWIWDLMNTVFFDNNPDLYNEDLFISKYNDYIEDIKNFFKGKDEKRLIIINLSEPNGIKKLCNFLNIETTVKEFPRITSKDIVNKNYSSDFLKN